MKLISIEFQNKNNNYFLVIKKTEENVCCYTLWFPDRNEWTTNDNWHEIKKDTLKKC